MASEQKNPEGGSSDAPTLISATLYLLSAFSANGCPRLAILIKRHLELLAAPPVVHPLVRSTSSQLIEKYWAAAAASAHGLLRQEQSSSQPALPPIPAPARLH